jgi:transcriptional regulator with XRE-family HTH domain
MGNQTTLGAEIRRLRLLAGFSLREFATKLGISAPHQSDIELSRRMPSDQLLQATAKQLASVGASYEALRALDARLEPDLETWVSNTPEVRQLLRETKDSGRPVRDVLQELRSMLRETQDDE